MLFYYTKEKVSERIVRQVYLYLVLFVTLMMSIGGAVSLFMNAADMIAPTPYHMNYDEYRSDQLDGKNKKNPPSEEAIKAKYNAFIEDNEKRAVDDAKNSLLKSCAWLIIPVPIFLVSLRLLRRDKKQTT
ncbi:hypothetical protein [Fictibacillus macauensis]|nr:hypothetical protein [Fictibacillus macauensis]